jgi:hypothetical protein
MVISQNSVASLTRTSVKYTYTRARNARTCSTDTFADGSLEVFPYRVHP